MPEERDEKDFQEPGPSEWESEPSEPTQPTDSDEEGLAPGSPESTPEEAAAPSGPKPFVSRLLGRMGIRTGPGVDWAIDWLQVLVIAGLLAWVVMTYVIVRMYVPTGSMEPTIMPEDSFFVDKVSYELGLNHPHVGDIVVFWHTETDRPCDRGFLFWKWSDPPPCQERYVKRLIGVGGDTVQIKQGKIYINGQQMTGPAFNRDYVCNSGAPRDPSLRDPNGCSWTVPDGKYFMLGDNTRNSSDSRYWGFADASQFIGEPFFRVWPFSHFGPMNGYFGSAP